MADESILPESGRGIIDTGVSVDPKAIPTRYRLADASRQLAELGYAFTITDFLNASGWGKYFHIYAVLPAPFYIWKVDGNINTGASDYFPSGFDSLIVPISGLIPLTYSKSYELHEVGLLLANHEKQPPEMGLHWITACPPYSDSSKPYPVITTDDLFVEGATISAIAESFCKEEGAHIPASPMKVLSAAYRLDDAIRQLSEWGYVFSVKKFLHASAKGNFDICVALPEPFHIGGKDCTKWTLPTKAFPKGFEFFTVPKDVLLSLTQQKSCELDEVYLSAINREGETELHEYNAIPQALYNSKPCPVITTDDLFVEGTTLVAIAKGISKGNFSPAQNQCEVVDKAAGGTLPVSVHSPSHKDSDSEALIMENQALSTAAGQEQGEESERLPPPVVIDRPSIFNLKTLTREDDWFEVIKKAAEDFFSTQGRLPSETELWTRIYSAPPHGYSITAGKNSHGELCLVMPGATKELTRKAFYARWKRYTESQ